MARLQLLPATSAIVLLVATLAGCTARGPVYQDATIEAVPLAADLTRLVFLRPKDRDDGAGGGRAVIRVNGEKAGGLAYSSFFYVDIAPGDLLLRASGPLQFLGACDLQLQATAGTTLFLDVGPRMAYMIAGSVGSLVGGALGGVATSNTFGSVGEAMVVGTAAVATGAAVGEVAAVTTEAQGKKCNGPYKFAVISAADATERLHGLTWSQ